MSSLTLTPVVPGTLALTSSSSGALGLGPSGLTLGMPADYVVSMVGAQARAQSLVPGLDSYVATDPAAVTQSAITALGTGGGTIVLCGSLSWGSIPALPRGVTGKLRIRGTGRTVITASSAGRRFFDMPYVADFDSYQNIEFEDITFDRNNVAPPSGEHVFCGNLIGGAWTKRGNYDRISFRRCKTINVPVGGASASASVMLVSGHLASNEGTQTHVTNILVEDCEWGGDYGFAFMGSAAAGGSVTTGQGVNVLLDEIHIVRGISDPGVVPTATLGAGNQIGGYGFCRKVRMTGWTSKNSADVGIEVDNCQDLVGVGCMIQDAWNTKYLVGNFRPPDDLASQRAVWRDCACRNVALDRAVRQSTDFEIFGSPNVASAVTFGELDVEHFESLDTITAAPFNGGITHLNGGPVTFRKARFHGKASYTALNVTTGANTFTGVRLRNTVSASEIDIDLTYALAGARSGTGNNQWVMTSLNGNEATVRARVSFDVSGFTGMSATSDTFYWCGIAALGASSVRCESLTARCLATLSATQGAHHGVYLSSNLTVAGVRAYVEKLDMLKASSGAGFDVNFQSATHKPQVLIRNTVSQRTAASGSGAITAPTGLTGLVTATGVTVGSVSAGVPCVVQFVQGSGAGITAIDVSTNGGTTYFNLLTQASGAMPAGADLVIGPVPPDALVKVTFATTQPTINLVPVNA